MDDYTIIWPKRIIKYLSQKLKGNNIGFKITKFRLWEKERGERERVREREER